MFINLTNRDIYVQPEKSNRSAKIPRSGIVAKARYYWVLEGTESVSGVDIPLYKITYEPIVFEEKGKLIKLPEHKGIVKYLIEPSLLTALRQDEGVRRMSLSGNIRWFSPDYGKSALRDSKGEISATRRFIECILG